MKKTDIATFQKRLHDAVEHAIHSLEAELKNALHPRDHDRATTATAAAAKQLHSDIDSVDSSQED